MYGMSKPNTDTKTIVFDISAQAYSEDEVRTVFRYELLDTEPYEVAVCAAWDCAYDWVADQGLNHYTLSVLER